MVKTLGDISEIVKMCPSITTDEEEAALACLDDAISQLRANDRRILDLEMRNRLLTVEQRRLRLILTSEGVDPDYYIPGGLTKDNLREALITCREAISDSIMACSFALCHSTQVEMRKAIKKTQEELSHALAATPYVSRGSVVKELEVISKEGKIDE